MTQLATPDKNTFLGDHSRIDLGWQDTVLLIAPFNMSRYSDASFDVLDVEMPQSMVSAIDKRKADFLAGRALTNRALKLLDRPVENIPIGTNRAPIWPVGIAGSITHSLRMCGCLMTTQRDLLVGVDLEGKMKPSSLKAARKIALSESDRVHVDTQTDIDPETLTAMIFSAKETLYKALHPIAQTFFGFEAATLTSLPNGTTFDLSLTQNIHPILRSGDTFSIHYRILENHVLTWLVHKI